MTGLRYVYAVCRPFASPLQAQLTGVAGDPPRRLAHRGLIAVVSHVPEAEYGEAPLRARMADPEWYAATARAHRTVVDALTAVTTPLPLRVGTVFRDDSGVRTVLEARESDFLRALDRLEGRVEWGVRLYADDDAPGEKEAEEGRPAPVELFASRLHEALCARAEDARLHAPCRPEETAGDGGPVGPARRNVLNAAYLVPRAASEGFVERVNRARDEEPGVRVELTGPWAAYSFAGERP
jgi:hypothetical protein